MIKNVLYLLLLNTLLLAQEIGQSDFSMVEGKTVRKITVKNQDIFEGQNPWAYRQVNNLKIHTQHDIVTKELTFKPGQIVTALMVKESGRNLRTLKYLDQIKIIPKIDGRYVDFEIQVKETWTLIPQISYSNTSGIKSRSVGLEDSNLFGMGKRLEMLSKEEENRSSVETVYDDRRLFGSTKNLVLGYFDRSDGDRYFFSLENPIRTLLDRNSWAFTADKSTFIGRLFENGDERSIFETDSLDLSSQYVFTKGDPETILRRYGIGWAYNRNYFEAPTAQDYIIVDVDPNEIDPSVPLPSNRRFSGITANYARIKANYIPINYIDRFERYEDYNLGEQLNVKTHYAPEFFGSIGDSFLSSASGTKGWSLGNLNFIRSEARLGNRIQSDGIKNTLFSLEAKHYKILGRKFLFGQSVGRHTLATNIGLDIGHKLDGDVELLAGADNSLRGYDARTFTGDKRFLFNFEDRIHIYDNIAKLISLGGAFFVDVGSTTSRSPVDLFDNRLYGNVGVGLRIGFPRSSGGRVLRVDIAFPLRSSPGEDDQYDPRFLVSAGQIFPSFFTSETNKNSPSVSSLYGIGN